MPNSARTKARERHTAEVAAAIGVIYKAIRTDVLEHIHAGRFIDLLSALWPKRLSDAARAPVFAAAHDFAAMAAADLGAEIPDLSRMDAYLDAVVENFGLGQVNALDQQLAGLERVAEAFEAKMQEFVAQTVADAESLAVSTGNFAEHDIARAVGATTKTWHTGENPRPTHAALNGVTIPIDNVFANGLRYPKAPGPPQETVNCNCELTFGRADL